MSKNHGLDFKFRELSREIEKTERCLLDGKITEQEYLKKMMATKEKIKEFNLDVEDIRNFHKTYVCPRSGKDLLDKKDRRRKISERLKQITKFRDNFYNFGR